MNPKPNEDPLPSSGKGRTSSERQVRQPPPPNVAGARTAPPPRGGEKARSPKASKQRRPKKSSGAKTKDDTRPSSPEQDAKSPRSVDRKRTLLAAGAAATLAAFGVLLLTSYLKSGEEQRALSAPVASRQVLVVREPIPSGTTLDELTSTRATDISSDFMPIEHIAQGSVATVEELEMLGDVMVEVDLQPGEQVLAARFVPTESFLNRVASVGIPEGHHQLSFALDPTRSLGGLIRPGDDISIVASFSARAGFEDLTSVILPSVEVTNVQSSEVLTQPSTDNANDVALTPGGNYLITVAVEPDELTRLSYAIDYGRIMVAAAIDATAFGDDQQELATKVQTLEGVLSAAAEDLKAQRTETLAFAEGASSGPNDSTASEETTAEASTAQEFGPEVGTTQEFGE